MGAKARQESDLLHEFTELWMSNQHVVSAFVRLQVRDYHVSEDIMQEVARRATEHFGQYDRSRPFTPWLIGIAKQCVAAHYRQASRNKVVFSTEVVDLVAQAYIDIQPDVDDRLVSLRHCVSQLGGRHRELVRQRYGQMLTPEAIAKRIGIRRNTINVMLHRIRNALAECMRQRKEAR